MQELTSPAQTPEDLAVVIDAKPPKEQCGDDLTISSEKLAGLQGCIESFVSSLSQIATHRRSTAHSERALKISPQALSTPRGDSTPSETHTTCHVRGIIRSFRNDRKYVYLCRSNSARLRHFRRGDQLGQPSWLKNNIEKCVPASGSRSRRTHSSYRL